MSETEKVRDLCPYLIPDESTIPRCQYLFDRWEREPELKKAFGALDAVCGPIFMPKFDFTQDKTLCPTAFNYRSLQRAAFKDLRDKYPLKARTIVKCCVCGIPVVYGAFFDDERYPTCDICCWGLLEVKRAPFPISGGWIAIATEELDKRR